MNPSGASVLFGPTSLAEWPLKELGETPDHLLWGRMGQSRPKCTPLSFLTHFLHEAGPKSFLITFNRIGRNKR